MRRRRLCPLASVYSGKTRLAPAYDALPPVEKLLSPCAALGRDGPPGRADPPMWPDRMLRTTFSSTGSGSQLLQSMRRCTICTIQTPYVDSWGSTRVRVSLGRDHSLQVPPPACNSRIDRVFDFRQIRYRVSIKNIDNLLVSCALGNTSMMKRRSFR